ncbi:hypothetical protein BV25DRAFT_1089220 [Artomyces pyxidatus]|uniref:Uncharacterized protein n=1 Tax=Artomyces pyxidatus TaxID=48021 RepID=A0ACB8TFY2_9AGAM|nr:hypothetical protein BV25DRAFT_1089220 [Artomyces pyxidatus]
MHKMEYCTRHLCLTSSGICHNLMHPTTVLLTRDSIVDLAKHVLKPLDCDWEGCSLVLNSWTTLRQHQHLHCRRSRNFVVGSMLSQENTFRCGIVRCSGREHRSLEALLAHVDMSHLVRVFLPCPVMGCHHTETLGRYLCRIRIPTRMHS